MEFAEKSAHSKELKASQTTEVSKLGQLTAAAMRVVVPGQGTSYGTELLISHRDTTARDTSGAETLVDLQRTL